MTMRVRLLRVKEGVARSRVGGMLCALLRLLVWWTPHYGRSLCAVKYEYKLRCVLQLQNEIIIALLSPCLRI